MIGALLTTGKAGFDGFKPVILFGRRLAASGEFHEFCAGERGFHGRGNVKWKSDQASAKSTRSAAGHLAPAMGRTNEDDAFDPGIGLKCCGTYNKLSLEFSLKCFSRFPPELSPTSPL